MTSLFSQNFARSLRISGGGEDAAAAADPGLLIRSASAPPMGEGDPTNVSGNGFVNTLDDDSTTASGSGGSSANNSKGGGSYSQQHQQYMYSQRQFDKQQQHGSAAMYGYNYSPGLHPANMAGGGFFDASGGSPFLGPSSGAALFQVPVPSSPGLAPYTPNLLPQSLLGTPPTYLHQQQQAQAQMLAAASAGLAPDYLAQGAGGAGMMQGGYSPNLGPASSGYYSMQQSGIHAMQLNLQQQQQQWMYGAGGHSPSLSGIQQQPQPLQMPMMQQLPPAAMSGQAATSPDSARYLRSESNQSTQSSQPQQQHKQQAAPHMLAGGNSSGHHSPVGDENAWGHHSQQQQQQQQQQQDDNSSGAPPQKKSSLLEELRSKMKQSSNGNQHYDYHNNQAQQYHQQPQYGHQMQSQHGYYQQQHGMQGGRGGGHQSRQGGGQMPPHMQQQQQIMHGGGNMMGGKNKSPTNGVAWGLRAILGQVCDFAKDQHGSRFIQQQLESSTVSDADKQALFEEVLPFARMLCTDVFGNYVIQKLLSEGQPGQQEQLVKAALEGNMLELSKHMYACRVIQKLIEKVFSSSASSRGVGSGEDAPGARLYSATYQDALLKELDGSIVDCVQDQNGNHVIQKCIEQVRPITRIDFILNAFKGNMVSMAMHPYGCRVAQRVMENCGEQSVKEALSELIAKIDVLVVDQFANYVVQHIIEAKHQRRDSDERRRVLKAVQDNVLSYSTHKFASNVVEKCLQYGDAQERRELIDKMLERPQGDRRAPCPLVLMMKDPYANYVVQKVIDRAENDQHKRVVHLVKENATALKKLTYGKHILTRLESRKEGKHNHNHNNRS